MKSKDRFGQLRAEVLQELTENILPFSMRYVMDREQGGFYGHVANDGTVQKQAPKGLVQHSRMLWTFAHAGRTLGDSQYAPAVSHAHKALTEWFWDREYGGFFWMVDCQGKPLQADKLVYGQAYAIYGLVEYHLASGKTERPEQAIELYRLLERHSRDPEQGGYWEACHRDWTPAPDQHVDDVDLPVAKGMNTHLHVLEAYTSLLRAWDDDDLRESLQALIGTMLDCILNADSHQLSLFFDAGWHSLSDRVSYGHDIEASWLLVEAAEVLGNLDLLTQAQEAAVQMAYVALERGVDVDGGLFYEGDPSGVTNRTKQWWPQAEAMVGFLNAYQLNGDPRFLDASLASWLFIKEHLVDREHGEWFAAASEAGHSKDDEKAGFWKTPYHNGRACLEVMRRIQKLTGKA